jgi:hypothetical protein
MYYTSYITGHVTPSGGIEYTTEHDSWHSQKDGKWDSHSTKRTITQDGGESTTSSKSYETSKGGHESYVVSTNSSDETESKTYATEKTSKGGNKT